MSFSLAVQALEIEHIGVWTLVPFLIAVVAGLAFAVAWVLRGQERG